MRFITPPVVWMLLYSSAFAQPTTGTIAGRVLDPQGAVASGATVTARNPQTGLVRAEATDDAGLYRLAGLPAAVYEIRVEMPGFATLTRPRVTVNVGQTQVLDFTLTIAPIAQEVTVSQTLPLIDLASSSVGQVVDLARVHGLPLNGRQFANLAATLPGVGLGVHSDPTKGANYAPLVNGGAGRNISYEIDGGDNNDDTVGGLLQQYPLEAIQEFRFDTQRFDAEHGRSNGGVMNVVTKSGTNQHQGTLFELLRDRSMNALTQTERLAAPEGGAPTKGDYRRHQFGGSLGGPVVLDRVHFFYAFERTQQDTTQTVNTKGLFPALDGIHPTPMRETLGTFKLSANLTPTQHLAVRYSRDTNRFVFNASPTTTPDNWGDARNWFNSINVNHTLVLGGSKLNAIVFQYADFRDHIGERTRADFMRFPSGIATGSSMAAPQSTEQVKYQIRNDFSWLVAGGAGKAHGLKAGVNFINVPRLFIDGAAGRGVASYMMLTDNPLGPVSSVVVLDGVASANIPTKQYGLYVQDDWQVSDRLTVNAGVRYDLVTGILFDQSKNPNFVKVQEAARSGALDGIVGLENFGLEPRDDRNNIQPRIGGVYDLTGQGRHIVRGGWGVYHDFGYTNSNVLQAALDASGNRYGPVFVAQSPAGLKNADGTPYQAGQPLENLASQNQAATGTRQLLGFWVDPRLQQPYQLHTNAGWSYELTSDTAISIDYVNSLGRDLNYKPRLNQLIRGTTKRRISARLASPLSPNNSSNRPALSRGRSRYDALVFTGKRRLSKGFDFLASYTLSKAVSTIGNASDELNTANVQDPNDPFDSPVQLGPNVTTDARHRVSVSAIVQVPYGVQVAPFYVYRSALPIFLVDGRDRNGDGDAFDIPDEGFGVASTDATTGTSTIESLGPCTTVNCGRGWGQSQLNLRVSKVFRVQRVSVEAIGEVFNLFNAINPSNIVAGSSANRAVFLPTGAPNPSLLQPASYSGDSQRPEQRVGQLGLRISF